MNRGFTLLEILLVLVLLGVITGMVTLMLVDNPGRQLQGEQERLAAVLRAAADEALLQGVDLGVVLDREGYTFVAADPDSDAWQPLSQRPLQAHVWPPGLVVELRVEGELLSLPPGGRERSRPTLLLLSSGELTPFELVLSSADGRQQRRVWSDGINLLALPTEP